MSGKFSLDDYIDVAERIVLFKEKYPNGTLQTLDWKLVEVAGKTFVVYQAAAFRSPEDERPGHGIAWEPFPGPTPYTKDSELMNAETAAWGRAIVAVGLAANRKIASRQEVRARQGAQEPRQPSSRPRVDPDSLDALRRRFKDTGWTPETLAMQLTAVGAQDVSDVRAAMQALSPEQARQLLSSMNSAVDEQIAAQEALRELEGAA